MTRLNPRQSCALRCRDTFDARMEILETFDQEEQMTDGFDDVQAQDVIDALRLACMAQDDDAKVAGLLRAMLEFAPETDSNRGVDLLIRLIAEGSLRVEMVDHQRVV